VANNQLFLKSMSDSDAVPIRGTDFAGGLANPVFSPDGQSIAFFSGGEIKKVSISGGTAISVVRDPGAGGQNQFDLGWNDDSLVIGAGSDGILRVPATGGTPSVLIAATNGEVLDSPQTLPDGRSVLFTAASADRMWDGAKIVVQAIGSTERKTLVEGAA